MDAVINGGGGGNRTPVLDRPTAGVYMLSVGLGCRPAAGATLNRQRA